MKLSRKLLSAEWPQRQEKFLFESSTKAGSKPTIDRPLIAYAFLAQATQKPGDLMSGLAPIFLPIAKKYMGKRFDAKQFSIEVAELYGILMSPWAVDDLAPRLEQAGMLFKYQTSPNTSEYIYAEVNVEFDAVTETEIQAVVERFIAFASPLLKQNQLSVDRKSLERTFFDELTKIDFHTIVQKPDRPEVGEATISLPKSPAQQQSERAVADKSRLDVLCAAFVVHMRETDKLVYDLIVRIAAGALVAQVVLNMQDPGTNVSLKGLRVVLDGPILMSILDLGDENNHEYARELCRELIDHEAALEVFRHSVDEIRDNLTASWHGAESGNGFGATVRRLRAPMYRSYVASVRGDLDGAIQREGIRIVEPSTRQAIYQYFSEEDEEGVFGMLGQFINPLAQKRDAASIAAVMRIRLGKHAKLGQFHLAHCIFVTDNPRVADCGARFAILKKLLLPNEVPPAVTDRYLAGTLWVLFGGKAMELTEYKLLASCSAALEPRNDVSSKVHKFLKLVDNRKAEHFRALMTSERSGQHLMQLTLGDSGLIRSTDDADRLLTKLDDEYRKQYQEESHKEVERVRAEAAAEVGAAQSRAAQQEERARAADAEAMITRTEIQEAQKAVELIRQDANLRAAQANVRIKNEQRRRLEEKLPIIEDAVRRSKGRYRLVRAGHACLLFVGIASAAFLGANYLTDWKPWLSIPGAVLGGLVSAVFFVMDKRFVDIAGKKRQGFFDRLGLERGFYTDISQFRVDWETGLVTLVDPHDQHALPEQ